MLFKKSVALVLATLMAVSAFAGLSFTTASANELSRVIFKDDCNGPAVNEVWAATGTVTADGEKYTLSKAVLFLSNNQGMQDYTFQADVSIPDTTYGTGIFANKGAASIVVRQTPSVSDGGVAVGNGYGYEFGLYAAKDSTDGVMVRLYERNGDGTLVNQQASVADLLYNGESAMALPGDVYTLSVTVSGAYIYCCVNGVEAFSVMDSSFTAGSVSLKAVNCVATYDNVALSCGEVLYANGLSDTSTNAKYGWSNDFAVSNGQMSIAGNGKNYLTSFADAIGWTNYSVEAFVKMDYNNVKSSNKGAQAGVVVAANSQSRSGIEFCVLDYNTTADWSGGYDCQQLRLYSSATGKTLADQTVYTADDTKSQEQIWAERPYKLEQGLTLKLHLISYGQTGMVIGYVNGQEVISAEITDTGLLCGAPGVYTAGNHTAYFSSFTVYNEMDYTNTDTLRAIQLVDLNGTPVESLELFYGFEIENTNYRILLTYVNGSTETVLLAPEHISYGSGLQEGQNQVTITYKGARQTLPVTVTRRPEYISQFVQKVQALDPATLTADTLSAATQLQALYNTLSPCEVAELAEDVHQKYNAILLAADHIRIPATAEYPLIFTEDFNENTLDTERWDPNYNGRVGAWLPRNGYVVNEQATFGDSGESWLFAKRFYGEIAVAQVDIALNAADVYAALAIHVGDRGYYQARLTNRRGNFKAELYNYSGSQILLSSQELKNYGITYTQGEFYTLTLTARAGVLQVYVNDVLVISCDNSSADVVHYEGSVGFRGLYDVTMYDNLRVYGVAMDPKPNADKNITPTHYTDDFEDETVGASPSHWIEAYDHANAQSVDNWLVYEQNGNRVYGTTAAGPTYSWLHGFEQNPTYSAKFQFNGSGRVGFITRMYDASAWLVLGYDTARGKWFMAATESTRQEVTQFVYADIQAPLTAGNWYTADIALNGPNVELKVNGATVFSSAAAKCNSYGRVGVFALDAQMYIDDVSVKSPGGTTFVDGVLHYPIADGFDRVGGYLEVESLGNGVMLGVVGSRHYLSTDYGASWRDITGTKEDYDVQAGGMGYTSLLNLGDGKWVQARVNWDNAHILVSNDNMATWRVTAEYLGSDEYVDALGNANRACIHVNSLTKATVNGKTRIFLPLTFRLVNANGGVYGHYTRFFYSDDDGYTWTESVNDSRDCLPGYDESVGSTTAEGKVVACADGALRYYQSRNGYGNIIYLESRDGGVSWTEFGTIPYMQCPKGSFSVTEDTYAPGTYYLTWVHNNPVKLGSIQPRVRISLARSTDGKNWEFLCDVERTSVYDNEYSSFVRQFLDPSIVTDENYVYVTYGRSNIGQSSTHNNQIPQYVRLEKAKLSPRAWDDATISDANFNERLELGVAPKLKYAQGETFTLAGGTVKEVSINGTVIERKMRNYTMVSPMPDTSTCGTYTVTLVNPNMHILEFDVQVVPQYNLSWSLQGVGEVKDQADTLLQGDSQSFTLAPAVGYSVGSVTVNGVAVPVFQNRFTIENMQQDTTVVVRFLPEGKVLLDEAFAGDSLASAWNATTDKISVANGVATFDKNAIAYLQGGTALQNYTVSANISLPQGYGTSTTSMAVASLVARSAAADSTQNAHGYELGLLVRKSAPTDLKLRLYERGDGTSQILDVADLLYNGDDAKAPADGTYHLTLAVQGSTVRGYINGVLAFDVLDDTLATGTVGLKAVNCNMACDSLLLVSQDEMFIENYTADTAAWSQAAVANGENTAIGYLTAFAGALSWQNYSLQANVRVDYTAPGNADGNQNLVGIVGYAADAAGNNGLGFALVEELQTGAYSAQLFHQSGLGVLKTQRIAAVDLAQGVCLKLELYDTTLCGYVDDTPVIEYTLTAQQVAQITLAGTVGLWYSSAKQPYYSQVKVRALYGLTAEGEVSLNKAYAAFGQQVQVTANLNPGDDLTYTCGGNQNPIFLTPALVYGSGFGGAGNSFLFAMPAGNTTVGITPASTAASHTVATVGTAIRVDANQAPTALRFLNRVYLPKVQSADGLVIGLDTSDVQKIGAFIVPQDLVAVTGLNALQYVQAYLQGRAGYKVFDGVAYSQSNGAVKMYDVTGHYADFTVAVSTQNTARSWVCISYYVDAAGNYTFGAPATQSIQGWLQK